MNRLLPAALVALTLFLATPFAAAAQFPPATPEQRAAGARIAEVRYGVEELVVPRGETVALETRLLDASGAPVQGAVVVLLAQGGVGPTFAAVDGPTVDLTGMAPGTGRVRAVIMVPQSEGDMFGVAGARVLGDLSVTVLDYPATSIEIADPGHTLYTSTSIRMDARVLTTEGGEHASATIAWSSSNPSAVAVTQRGVVTGLSAGTATLTASTENGVTAEHRVEAIVNPVVSMAMSPATAQTRRGDVVAFDIVARDVGGNVVDDIALDLAVSGLEGTGGFVFDDGTFLGDEIGTADGMRGYIHVIDVSDIENPKEVAKYDLPEAGTHNVWVEDELLYIAYYQGGLRIVDVSGTLRGDLYRQGREIGFFRTEAAEGEGLAANSANAWGPQPFKGNLFVSDMTSGLWVVKHARPRPVS
jgi:hypothetical protein